jgi:nucleotide-binding universal stress UspA family protein
MPRLDISTNAADGTPFVAGALPRVARRVVTPALDPVFPLLLAIADDETAAASIRIAHTLADKKGAVPTVVRALGDMRAAEVAVSPLGGIALEEYFSQEYKRLRRDAVETQVRSVAGQVEWTLDITDQSPIDAIVARASESRAGLIVMGLRHHGVLRRAISRDLLGEVLRVTRVPVLAVRSDLSALPKRVVVAIDFGGASIRAANLACHLIDDDGAMYFVHVSRENSDGLRARLDALIDELAPPPGVTVSSILLHGDVQSSIEGLAHAVGADLLAVGNEEHSLFDRVATGSMSMKLAHTARWSTLVVPSRHASL